MPAKARLFDDPDFRALPRARQRQFFASIEPEFGQLSEGAQDAFLDSRAPKKGMLEQFADDSTKLAVPEGWQDLGRSAKSAVQAGAAGIAQTASNALMLSRKAVGSVLPGYEEPRPAEAFLARRAQEIGELSAQTRPREETSVEKVVGGLAGVPLSLVPAAAAAYVGGPVAGFAGLGALGAAHEGGEAMLREGVKGGAIGGVFRATEGARALVRGPAVGAATYALSDEKDPVRLGTEVATMAGLAVIGPGRRLPQRVVSGEMEARAHQVRRRMEQPREPVAEPQPTPQPVPPPPAPVEPPRPEPGPNIPGNIPQAPAPAVPTPPASPTTPAPAAPAPPIAPGKPPVAVGSDAPIRVEGQPAPLPARYELVELGDITASHDPLTFSPRPEYRGAQERDYQGDKNEQGKVISRADQFDPREVLNDSPNATSGPPIVGPESSAWGGNGRTMMLERIYGGKAKYAAAQLKADIVAAAGRFGIDPALAEGMERPIIVRRLAEVPSDAAGRLNLSRMLNIDPGFATTSTARAQSQAAALRRAAEAFTEAVERAPADLPTIRQAIAEGPGGRAFARGLQEDGIIPPSETSRWLTAEGMLTKYGLDQAEQILLARIIPDLRLVESMPAALREKMLRTVPLAMRVESLQKDALAPLLTGVVRSEIARQASGMSVEEFARQIPLGTAEPAPSQLSPRIAKLHKLFVEGKPNEIRKQLAEVARGIEDTAAGQIGMFSGKVPTVDDAFTAADLSRVPRVGETRGNWADPEPDRAGPPGANYTGFRDFTPQNIDVPLPKKIISAGDALERLARALKVPVQQGNLRALSREPGVLGYARANLSRLSAKTRAKSLLSLRVKRWGDIQTSTHEIAHILDARSRAFSEWYDPRLTKGGGPTQAQLEVNALSYDASKPYEGFAEFVRLWFTQRPKLEQLAPVAPREFDALLPKVLTPKEHKAMLRAQKEMHSYFEQGAQAAARTIIGPNNEAGSVLSTEFDRLRQVAVDRFHGILMADRLVRGGDPTAPERVWATFKELDRISSLEEGLISDGAPRWKGPAGPNTEIEFVGDGVATILGRVAKSQTQLADFYHYALAKMATIANAHGIETPYTAEMRRDGLARETPEFRRAYEELAELRENVLKFAISSGQFSKEQAAEWRFRGQMAWSLLRERGAPPASGGGMRGLLQERGIYKMKGSSRNFTEPLDAILGGASKLIRLSMENLAVKQFYTDIVKAPGGGRIGEHIPAEHKPVTLKTESVEEAVSTAVKNLMGTTVLPKGWLSRDPSMNEFLQIWIGGQAPSDAMQRVFSYRENGKPVYIEVFDPVVAQSLALMRKEPAGAVLDILGALPRRLEQMMITIHPKFLYRQLIRDPIAATIHTRTGAQAITSSISGWGEAMKRNSAVQRAMQANLGAGSEFRHRDVKTTSKEIIRRGRRANATTVGEKMKGAVLDISNPMNYVRALQALGRGVDRGPRLGEAKRSLRAGETERVAARRYAEVTTDFAGEGSGRVIDQSASRKERIAAAWTKLGIHTFPFYRAMVNSQDKLYRDVVTAEGWRARVATKVALIALSQVALHALYRDDEDYQDIPEEIKNANIYLGKVTFPGDDKPTWITLPSTYEVGSVARLVSRSLDEMLDSGDRDLVKYAKDMMNVALTAFGVNQPTIAGALYEQATNRTSMGFLIESQGQQNLEPFYRTGPGVPPTLEAAARVQRHLPEGVPQLSPARANALFRSFFGNWVSAAFAVPDYALFPERRVDTRWGDFSFAPPFQQRVGKYSQAERDFYELAERVQQTVSTARAAELRNDPEIRDEELADPKYRLRKRIGKVQDIIAELRNRAEGAKRDPALTPKQRREESEALRLEIRDLERQTLGQARSLERELGGKQ